MQIKEIGVIGAGQMGSGIAHVAALSGYNVVMIDQNEDALHKSKDSIAKNMTRQVNKGKISAENQETAFNRIQIFTSVNALANCDLIIEAATEEEHIKEKIFKSVSAICKETAILASNTSSISITRLASYTDHPENFIGMHFMNPVPLMKLVEMIKGLATSNETYEAALEVAHKMGKTVATSEDYPGFIVNRILMPMINEACFVLQEGIADVKSIDQSMKLGTAHPMGPLALADFIGLDTCLSIMRVLHNELGDSKYRPCPLLVKYVEAGWLGKKVGKGFYTQAGLS
ncbi:MAG: 3-hydroxybutyryl-CoA dehydrogenase [Alphaproteobacteria bacterium]|jgi:3-hydroxybutyryl-CoA dehydrogenase